MLSLVHFSGDRYRGCLLGNSDRFNIPWYVFRFPFSIESQIWGPLYLQSMLSTDKAVVFSPSYWSYVDHLLELVSLLDLMSSRTSRLMISVTLSAGQMSTISEGGACFFSTKRFCWRHCTYSALALVLDSLLFVLTVYGTWKHASMSRQFKGVSLIYIMLRDGICLYATALCEFPI